MNFPNLVLESKSVVSVSRYSYFLNKTTEIATSWENRKNSIFNICIFFDWFLLILVENDLKWNFKWKKVKTSTFQFFRFSQEVAILVVLLWESSCILTQKRSISIPRPDLESTLNSTMSLKHENTIWDHYSGLRWPQSRQKVKNLQLGSKVSFVENQISRFF